MIACGFSGLFLIGAVAITAFVSLIYASWNAARIEEARDQERERLYRRYGERQG